MTDYKPYLKTLRRIPAPIIQAMATRPIEEPGDVCLCGWAIREDLAFANGQTADEYDVGTHTHNLSYQRFGGTFEEWGRLFFDIIKPDKRDAVETAFAIRVAECVR